MIELSWFVCMLNFKLDNLLLGASCVSACMSELRTCFHLSQWLRGYCNLRFDLVTLRLSNSTLSAVTIKPFSTKYENCLEVPPHSLHLLFSLDLFNNECCKR